MACGHPVRGFPQYTCSLDEGHRGYHSCATFVCDACGKARRNPPAHSSPLGYDHDEGYFLTCFICAVRMERDQNAWWDEAS